MLLTVMKNCSRNFYGSGMGDETKYHLDR